MSCTISSQIQFLPTQVSLDPEDVQILLICVLPQSQQGAKPNSDAEASCYSRLSNSEFQNEYIIRTSLDLKPRHLIHPFVFSHWALMHLIRRLRKEELGTYMISQFLIWGEQTQNRISNTACIEDGKQNIIEKSKL